MKKVLFHREARVAALQVPRAVVPHAMPERQVLGAGGGPDGVRLDEAQRPHGGQQRGGREQGACDGVTPQVGEGDRHRYTGPRRASTSVTCSAGSGGSASSRRT